MVLVLHCGLESPLQLFYNLREFSCRSWWDGFFLRAVVHGPIVSASLGCLLEMQNSGPTQDVMNYDLPCNNIPGGLHAHGCLRSTILVTVLFLPLCYFDKACVDWPSIKICSCKGNGWGWARKSENKSLHRHWESHSYQLIIASAWHFRAPWGTKLE